MKNKKKKISYGSIGIVPILCLFSYYNLSGQHNLVLKTQELNIEYGETISTKVNDYLNTKKTSKKALDDAKLDLSNIIYETNNDYPAIGEYTIKIISGKKEHKVRVKITDTIKPKFNDFKEVIEIFKDCRPSNEDLEKMYSAKDLSPVTITVDDSAVDYTQAGEYKAVIKAIDSSKNETSQETTIKIIEPKISLNSTSITLNINETFNLITTVEGKESQVNYQISNPSIITIDNNGKVTAIAKGNAIITATANGVSAKCNVTAKEVTPSASNKNTICKPNKNTTNKSQVNNSTESSYTSNSSKPLDNTSYQDISYDLQTAKQAFDIQNQKRTEAGIPPLQWNEKLHQAAKIRVTEIITHWSHTRPDGTWVKDLLNNPNCLIGENLSKGYSKPSSVISSWMDSQGHRANILNKNFTYGVIVKYENYWVSLFAGPGL